MQSDSLSKDACDYFKIQEQSNIDDLFIDFISKREKHPTPLRLCMRYKRSYSKEFRSIILNYIHLSLTYPFDSSCNDPLVLLKSVCEANSPVHECLVDLGLRDDSAHIFMYLLYHIGEDVSSKLITEDIFQLYDGFKFICGLACVRKELKNRIYWGLETGSTALPRSVYSKLDVSVNKGFNKQICAKYAGEFPTLVGMININEYFLPYSGFDSTQVYPCFLDGLFEPFFYNHTRIVPQQLSGMSRDEARKFEEICQASFKTITSLIHETIFNLVKSCKDSREHFLAYVRQVYLYNTEVTMMVFSQLSHITNGFCYNLCNVLDKFCDKIIIENRFKNIDFLYINRIAREAEHINKNKKNKMPVNKRSGIIESNKLDDTHKFDEGFNAFTSSVIAYKILFMNFSYVVIYDKLKEFRRHYRQIAVDRRPKVMNFIIMYQIVISIDFLNEQNHFFNFMIENALRYEKIEEVERRSGLEEDICKLIIENETVSQEDQNIVLDNLFYLPITKLMSICFEEFQETVPENLYELIGVIMSTTLNIHDKKSLLRILAQRPFAIKKKLFESLCEMYIKVQKYEIYERTDFRICLNPIIYEDLNRNMANVKKEGMKLLLCAIKDLEKFLGTGLDSIGTIKTLTETIRAMESQQSSEVLLENEEYKKKKQELEDNRIIARNVFYALEGTFKLILYIIETNFKLFLYGEIKFMLINTLNYNLRLLVGPKCNSLSISNMEKYSFKPKEILGLLCSIFSYFKTDDLITETVESKDFNMNIMKRALTIAKDRDIMSSMLLRRFEEFTVRAEAIHNQVVVDTKTIVYPEEFLDPLTFDVMKDPVRLKTSNMVVDRSTFNLILAGDGVDPFNREKLDEDSVIEENKLLEQIRKFRKDNA